MLHFLPLGSLPKAEVKYLQACPSQSSLPFYAFSVPSLPLQPGHLGKRMFCRRNLEMCRCWEAGLCIFWQFPSTEFHWRQATEIAVRNFILMSTFVRNQQVANSEVLMLPSLCRDSPGLRQSWKRWLFFQTLYFPHFPEVDAAVSGHLHSSAKAWLCSRAWLTEGWTQQPCASLNNARLPSFT